MAEMIKTVSEKDILTRGPDCLTAGVISDTHGMLVPEVLQSLMGVDLIIHAGDIDTPFVLDELNRIAPTVAVRGDGQLTFQKQKPLNWAITCCIFYMIFIAWILILQQRESAWLSMDTPINLPMNLNRVQDF